ncbi:MAG TPA: MiaB/RimO family radical SAM methylthiotransferase [Candidatus Bathyarchaeia archaeon]|nr:MiaB/RimO family radical SAM methylthiotransferase [Candidatus Bathyarchaeia archaeon]
MKTCFIKTFGCQANEADSERLASVFEKKGYQLAERIEEAGVVVINTCSVRESAENRVFGLINNLAEEGKNRKIILTGCMVGSARGERRRYSPFALKRRLPQVDEFKTIEELIGPEKVTPKRKKKTSAFIPIMEGCDNFCSYCVVPYARGKENSRPFEKIVCEVKKLAKRGYKEITLIGQNVNSYGKSLKPKKSFSHLLTWLQKIKGIKKISFMTSNPWDLTDDIIEAMASPKVDRYLHLPVQSGDDQVLKKMNRPYTAQDYLELVKKIRKKIPDIRIGTDIIVGFPGETKKAFENTVKLCQKVGFVKAYLARYSPRPGTTAFKLKDNILPEEKRRRWQVLEKLINKPL